MASRNATRASAAVEAIKADHPKARVDYVLLELSSMASVRRAAAVVAAEPRLDVLINNAGILRDKSFLKMDPDNWNAVLGVHLNGAYHVTRPAMQVMKEKGYGRIVMTTSAAGLYGNFGQTNYSAAKMGLVGLMNTIKLVRGALNPEVELEGILLTMFDPRNNLSHQVAEEKFPCMNSTGIPSSGPAKSTRVVNRPVVTVFAVIPGIVLTKEVTSSLNRL